MKWYVWVLNSWLVGLFIITAGLNFLLKQKPPHAKKTKTSAYDADGQASVSINLEKIYQNDLFDTYKVVESEPTQKDLVTPIPELNAPTFSPPPEPAKPKLLPPLEVTLKGVILSSDDENSIAMIADKTNKEASYRVGAKLQDAILLKIGRNRVVLLRSNGQQETLYLRKPQEFGVGKDKDPFARAVKKITDEKFEIDLVQFKKRVTSLGEFLEELQAATSFKEAQPIGVRIGTLDPNGVGSIIGLLKNDIITAINGIQTGEMRNRIDIYDKVSALNYGDTITVELLREEKKTTITYTLKKFKKPLVKEFTGGGVGSAQQPSKLPQSPAQKQAKAQRTFAKTHPSTQQQTIQALRKRLLENIKMRSRNMRVQ